VRHEPKERGQKNILIMVRQAQTIELSTELGINYIHSYMTVKEKEYNNFKKWIEANRLIAYKDKYYTNTSVDGWTLKQLRRIYNKENKNLNCI